MTSELIKEIINGMEQKPLIKLIFLNCQSICIAITKNTALASVVAVQEMLTVAQTSLAYAANTSPLTLAALGYLLVFFPLVVLSRWIETRFAWKR